MDKNIQEKAFLTGKAQEEFWNWYLSPEILKEHKLLPMFKFSNENIIKVNFLAMPDVCQKAIIVEWFDSIGFHIGRDMVDNYWLENSTFFERLEMNGYDYIAVLKSVSEAIEKSNELYNTHFLDFSQVKS
jgi:hypothetical protein